MTAFRVVQYHIIRKHSDCRLEPAAVWGVALLRVKVHPFRADIETHYARSPFTKKLTHQIMTNSKHVGCILELDGE